jgi:hypothetical protein
MKWALKVCCGQVAITFLEKGWGENVGVLENYVSTRQHHALFHVSCQQQTLYNSGAPAM